MYKRQANYLVAYLPAGETNGVMRFRADCNTGQMGYELRDGGTVSYTHLDVYKRQEYLYSDSIVSI